MKRTADLEILLLYEYQAFVLMEVLGPYTLAKLLVASFPSMPDAFLITHIAAQVAAERGLLSPLVLEEWQR